MFQQDFSKGVLLLMELPWHFNRKSNNHIWVSVFLNSLFCPLPYILILRHSHTVLITVASVSWKSSNFAILCLKFLNTQGPIHFHKILESIDQFLPPQKKNSTAIFIGIESYLSANLWTIYISTILKLPVHTHGICLCLPHKNELWTISTYFPFERIYIELVFFIPKIFDRLEEWNHIDQTFFCKKIFKYKFNF